MASRCEIIPYSSFPKTWQMSPAPFASLAKGLFRSKDPTASAHAESRVIAATISALSVSVCRFRYRGNVNCNFSAFRARAQFPAGNQSNVKRRELRYKILLYQIFFVEAEEMLFRLVGNRQLPHSRIAYSSFHLLFQLSNRVASRAAANHCRFRQNFNSYDCKAGIKALGWITELSISRRIS